jgi:predicted nucleic acid-binding protein
VTALVDGSVLIAAAFEDHTHNAAADRWFQRFDGTYAT